MPKTRASVSHRGQAHASPRKRNRQVVRRVELAAEALDLGISVMGLLQRKYIEVTKIIGEQSRRLAASAAAERAARDRYGFGTYDYWKARGY